MHVICLLSDENWQAPLKKKTFDFQNFFVHKKDK